MQYGLVNFLYPPPPPPPPPPPQIGRFRTVTLVWMHWWLWNDVQSLKQHKRVPYTCSCSRSFVKFQGHMGQKIADFDTNWALLDCTSSLNSPMALKCYTKLEVWWKRRPVVCQCHPSHKKVTWDKKAPIWTRIKSFRTVTPVWIHLWIWNDS